jgi:hypothetical protein
VVRVFVLKSTEKIRFELDLADLMIVMMWGKLWFASKNCLNSELADIWISLIFKTQPTFQTISIIVNWYQRNHQIS